MTPLQLLAVWRQRWGKENPTDLFQPYLMGSLGQWEQRTNRLGATPAVPMVLLFVALCVVMVNVSFSPINHWWFSACILVVSLFVRPYQGALTTLILTQFFLFSLLRYFYWRLEATLEPAYSFEFFTALGLLVIEGLAAVWFGLMLLQAFWPLHLAAVALPEDDALWPTVSLFVVGTDASDEAVLTTVAALKKTSWPAQKLTLTVLDGLDRNSLRFTLADMQVAYRSALQPQDVTLASQINRAMTDTTDELAVVVQAGQVPQPQFLADSAGWLVADAQLGMLATPRHFLLPLLKAQGVTPWVTQAADAELMVTRVSWFLKANGLTSASDGAAEHLANRMQHVGAGHGFWVRGADASQLWLNPLTVHAWRWRLAIAQAKQLFEFCQPLVRGALWSLPLFFALGDWQPFKVSLWVWLAYATPVLVQALVLMSRTRPHGYWSNVAVLREALLSSYLLILTLFTLLWTKLKMALFDKSKPLKGSVAGLGLTLWDSLMLLSHLLALVVMASLLGQAEPTQRATLGFYLAWSAVIVLLLLAKYAVTQEAQAVLRQQQSLRVMPVMLRLPNNRTLSCQTLNFPAHELQLALPVALSVQPGQRLKMSVFHDLQELALDVRVSACSPSTLVVQVDAAWQLAYDRFSQAVFVRGADWPAWLPGQSIDRLGLAGLLTWLVGMLSKGVQRVRRQPVAPVTDVGQNQ